MVEIDVLKDYKTYLNSNFSSKNTINSYLLDIKKLNMYYDNKSIEKITVNYHEVEEYITYLKLENYSKATLLRVISSINTFNKFLYKKNIIEYKAKINISIINFEKETNSRQNEDDFFTKKEIKKILDFNDFTLISLRDKAIFELVYSIGIKPSDCINLELSNINFNIGYLKYFKNNVTHTYPLNYESIQSIKNYLRLRKKENIQSDFLFVSEKGKKLTRQAFWKIFKRRQKDINLKKELTPTTFRNSLVLHLIDDGLTLEEVRDIFGLSSTQSLKKCYVNIKNKNLSNKFLKIHPRNKLNN
ncbi:tyrosine-type recombinase/integrase [Gemelliphila asaccharolytica]|uniref:Phage integrase, SAM-like domain protein n=1 Tax=Gemelliphila asaccharolytica TaxID=502393 RepID=A0ABR5TNC5_9BACL|nr:tyrosine-type recombinase/integrase [Gemella asaccharolytica]KXB58563.1 phage integrase, SAM-like domain protein [Gemella asaccharolytica]